jgi:poly-gamma-glutamate synthesis protein (capsule biosynthesis protein)
VNRSAAGAAAALAAVLGLAACTSGTGSPAAPRESLVPSVQSPSAVPEVDRPEEPLVVIGHATVPQLDLTAAQAERLLAGKVRDWRGFHVVRGGGPAALVRAVARDPSYLAVVPVSAVGPTVVAARVDGYDPVRDAAGTIDLTVAGDLMLVRGVPDAAAALAPLAERLRGADLTVGNLESTLSRNGEPTQDPVTDSFGATPALVPVLRAAGFDAVSLANNHVGDFGGTALLETVRTLRSSKLQAFGAGRDLAAAGRAALLTRNGVSFAFLGFNAIGETPMAAPDRPGALSVRMPPRTGPLVRSDLDHLAGLVAEYDDLADVVVVLPHWGEQYVHEPWQVQRDVARRLVRSGADLVVGGHPHWVQGVEAVDGVPVVHSLGNFVFDMDFMEQTLEGVLLEATFWGSELKAVRFVPYRMDTEAFAPRVARGEAGAAILADLWGSSRGPWDARGPVR